MYRLIHMDCNTDFGNTISEVVKPEEQIKHSLEARITASRTRQRQICVHSL